MHEILARMGSDEILLVIFLLTGAIGGLAVFFTLQWRHIRQAELDAALKQDMLNRGFSPQEIKSVLEVSGARDLAQEKPVPAPEPNKGPAAEIRSLGLSIESQIMARVKHVLTRIAGRL